MSQQSSTTTSETATAAASEAADTARAATAPPAATAAQSVHVPGRPPGGDVDQGPVHMPVGAPKRSGRGKA